jgi:hypothetical protein
MPSLQTQLAIAKWARSTVWEVVGLIGFGAVVDGVGLIYRPAAFIVAGLGLVGAAVLMSRRAD